MSGASTQWTYAEYARLPDDGNRYEVLDGELLRSYVQEYDLGDMLWDLDLLFVSGQFLRPDMQFVPTSQEHLLTERGNEGRPGLIVEVLSPGSVRNDKVTKPARYADFGVPEYWVLDSFKSGAIF
ncbi:MAG: Uma2 family endonuclease [Gemmatimonadota bacterium]